jgi:hypothetical protein
MKTPPTPWGSFRDNVRRTHGMFYAWLGFGAVTFGKYSNGGYTGRQALLNTAMFAVVILTFLCLVSIVTYFLERRNWKLEVKRDHLKQIYQTWRTVLPGQEFPHLAGNPYCVCHLCKTDPSLARLSELGDR